MRKVETIECPVEEALNYMQEEIEGLAEDIVHYSDALDSQTKNLSDTVDILGCLQKANKMMLDIIVEQNEEIEILQAQYKSSNDKFLGRTICFIVWGLILSFGVLRNVFQ